jgi:hypothetical protein
MHVSQSFIKTSTLQRPLQIPRIFLISSIPLPYLNYAELLKEGWLNAEITLEEDVSAVKRLALTALVLCFTKLIQKRFLLLC